MDVSCSQFVHYARTTLSLSTISAIVNPDNPVVPTFSDALLKIATFFREINIVKIDYKVRKVESQYAYI